jgi:hypothetical protein
MSSPIPHDPSDATLAIPPRFCGPPGTGNGGYVAGRLAAHVVAAGPVEVTLLRPVPLEAPLRVSREGAEAPWTLSDAAGAVARARAVPEAPRFDPPVKPRVEAGPAHGDHPFPGCFVCGPQRAHGDGLRIAPAPVSEGVVAAPWTPPADLADARREVDPAVVWAALDCPGYFAWMGSGPLRPLLLGRMTGLVETPIRAGDPYVVVGWGLARSGRRYEAATALLDRNGRVVARSLQTWIAPREA